MPGRASHAANEYYAYKHNHFWKLIYEIFDARQETAYSKKAGFLREKHVALWDVLRRCRRPGSSADSAIKGETPNDIAAFIKRYASIKHIYFNGRQAEKYFKKYFGNSIKLPLHTLPSTSPANAGLTFQRKLARWKKIRAAYIK
jgi:TDG/mug DNA glycosylase family protein